MSPSTTPRVGAVALNDRMAPAGVSQTTFGAKKDPLEAPPRSIAEAAVTPSELRVHLHRNGYAPLPLSGKAPVLQNWQQKTETNAQEIELWSSIYPGATNTGALTRLMPTLDLDILNEEAVRAAEEIVRSHHEEHGLVLVRIGRPPKRAIPFRTDEPFKKIQVGLIAPNGEFLCDGQQVAVAGLHPDINQPYRWHGGELGQTAREDLPYIREAEARALVDEIVDLLCSVIAARPNAQRKHKAMATMQRAVLRIGNTCSRTFAMATIDTTACAILPPN